MSELVTSIDIHAPPSRVWAVLTDFPAYPRWNPFVVSIQGELRVGAKLAVRLATPGKPAVAVRPVITTLEPERRLAWTGFAITPGFFDGEHRFELQRLGDAFCRLIHGERFDGVFAPIVAPLLLEATRQGFINMNKALKDLAESDIPPLV